MNILIEIEKMKPNVTYNIISPRQLNYHEISNE